MPTRLRSFALEPVVEDFRAIGRGDPIADLLKAAAVVDVAVDATAADGAAIELDVDGIRVERQRVGRGCLRRGGSIARRIGLAQRLGGWGGGRLRLGLGV